MTTYPRPTVPTPDGDYLALPNWGSPHLGDLAELALPGRVFTICCKAEVIMFMPRDEKALSDDEHAALADAVAAWAPTKPEEG